MSALIALNESYGVSRRLALANPVAEHKPNGVHGFFESSEAGKFEYSESPCLNAAEVRQNLLHLYSAAAVKVSSAQPLSHPIF